MMVTNQSKTFQVATRDSPKTKDPGGIRTRHDVPSLPNEILLAVMSYSSRETFYNLCLVSRLFNALAQPLLYQDYSQVNSEVPFWPFMRTLLARPDLASRVQEIEIYSWDELPYDRILRDMETGIKQDIGPERKAWKERQDAELNRLIRHIWEGFKEPSFDDEDNDEDNDSNIIFLTWGEKELVLLLSLVPNLDCLRLMLPAENKQLSCVLQHAMSSWGEDHRLLTKLTTLEVLYDEMSGGDGFQLSQIAPLLEFPNLKVLIASSCLDSKDFRPEPGSFGIQNIRLNGSFISDDVLEGFIRACRTLKKLRVEYGDDEVECIEEFDFKRIARSFARGLEVLILDIEPALTSEGWPTIKSDIGSLEHLESLRHLDLPQSAFSGVRDDFKWQLGYESEDEQDSAFAKSIFADRFPSGLQTLHIRVCTPRLIPHLWYCHSYRSEILPNLKALTIWEDYGDEINSHEDSPELQKAFKDLGITLLLGAPEISSDSDQSESGQASSDLEERGSEDAEPENNGPLR